VFLVFILGVVGLLCQYHSQVIGWKTRPQNDLLCVEWDGKLLTHQALQFIPHVMSIYVSVSVLISEIMETVCLAQTVLDISFVFSCCIQLFLSHSMQCSILCFCFIFTISLIYNSGISELLKLTWLLQCTARCLMHVVCFMCVDAV